ncbi:MAG: hypothetical protein LDL39_01580 [Magnetospirillum sp.]|nr:hypothetical protein [Magnetospirillum sp.]
MPVLLRHSRDLDGLTDWDSWCAVSGAALPLEPARRVADLAVRLEQAFDAIRDPWWELGRALAGQAGGELAHAPTCTTYGSDMGLMMAWAVLAESLAGEPDRILLVCDDPWLFRQLAGRPGISPGSPPPLRRVEFRLALRGLLARARLALRVARAALATRALRDHHHQPAAPCLLVYGHPGSDGDGKDAYFGDLMARMPNLLRLLHTDCPAGRAKELAADGRTASLHAWGNPWFAALLPFRRWRPPSHAKAGRFGWLVRRAEAKEGGGGAAAANRWQMHCQRRWLRRVRPSAVAWPWENHPWERDFVRAAHRAGTRSIGYQHTVVGPHMYNQSPAPNPDGLGSIPDLLIANGPAYRDFLEGWGVPASRLRIGGAFRISSGQGPLYDPTAPIFVALSNDPRISAQMMEALAALPAEGPPLLVKDHPMYPFPIAEQGRIHRAATVLPEHQRLSAVVYSTGTVGLEGLLFGLPTLRFRPQGIVAMNILPPQVEARAVDASSIAAALAASRPPPPLDRAAIVSEPDYAVWREALDGRG